MHVPPSELWEMDGEEFIFWFDRLKDITEQEHKAMEKR
jgi:hypothetical protein